MLALKPEYQALRQQHEFTVMELTDLKQKYESIKKLNTTILENMMKQPCDFLNEIKLVIDGSFYNQKVLDLQSQLEVLRNRMSQEVEKRVQDLMKGLTSAKHDCQNCLTCKELWGKCTNCSRYLEKNNNLQKVIEQRNEMLDKLRLQLEDKKAEIQVIQYKKSNERIQKCAQLEQINKMLKSNVSQLQEKLEHNEQGTHRLSQLYQLALEELEQYRKQQRGAQNHNNYGKKNNMVKEIQHIIEQLGNRPSLNGNAPRLSKMNLKSSKVGLDSDFSNFSIKDAINRPNQFTYY